MKRWNYFDARLEDDKENLENSFEVKRKMERHRMEDQRFHRPGKIGDLEAENRELLETVTRQSGEGTARYQLGISSGTARYQLEKEFEQLRDELAYSKKQLADAEQREENFKEQLGIVKRSLRDKDGARKEVEILRESERRSKELADALVLENTRLREELEDQEKLLDQVRRENSSLRLRNTDSDELERDFQLERNFQLEGDFQLQKQLIMAFLEEDASKVNRAEVKDTAEVKEDSLRDKVDQLERLLREKEAALENEVMEKWKVHAEKEEQRRAFEEKETELRNRVEELSNALVEPQGTASEDMESARNAELRAETERLVERHHEALVGRDLEHTLEVERLRDDWKTKLEELEDRLRRANANHNEKLSKALNDNKDTLEKLDRKIRECAELEKHLENCREELEKFRHSKAAAPPFDEDKIGKLERALVRLKLENDQLKTTKTEKGMKDLLREKESHIIDLQREVSSLREALKKRPALETSMLRASLDATGGNGDDPSSALVELFKARKKLNASGARIAQLEKWLDEIFQTDLSIDGGLLGPNRSKGSDTYRTGIVLPELKSQTRVGLVNRLSKPKPK